MDSTMEALAAMLEEVPDHDEIVAMSEGKEEEIREMIESLMFEDALVEENNDFEIIQIEDEEVDSNNVMVQEKENYILVASLGNKYWWEAYDLASEGENYTEYNWCYEDDLKMWEWSEYFEMPGLIEPAKAASEA
ncbi:uncharacterized protein LOC141710679 [Apium graveolens]|uniref:uncharacterized protein LOC141710679 n=1 Tax=Apium graveolens TaxID=4045 RepID=UPI003D796AE4